MSNALHTSVVLPNRESATRCNARVFIREVMRVAHKLWRHDTRAQLLDVTKASPRAVAYWMSRRSPNMTVDNLVALMRAEPAHFVPAVLGQDAYRELARAIIEQARLEHIERQQDQLRREIEQLRAKQSGA